MSEPIRIHHPDLECFIAVCQGCGTARGLYPNGYGSEHYSRDYYAYDTYRPVWKQRLKTTLWRMPGAERWFPVIPPRRTGRVLDVGCGFGLFLNLVQSIGWQTYGTEIFPDAVEYCRRKHQAVLADDASFSNAFFDWITMDNVLEHVVDPHYLLNRIRPWLKPDGRLTICVPNFGGIDSRFWGPHWYALMPPHHEFHYTGEGLKKLLSDCGFKCDLRFHIRFESRLSARNSGPAHGVFGLQARKLLHLMTASTISAQYGYFVTATAVLV